MNETIGLSLFVIGVLFDLFGCVGLVRLPDVYNRIQASTKCVVLGTVFVLLGAMFWIGTVAVFIKGLLCIVFVLITSATAAHALSRAAHRSGVALAEGSIVDKYSEDMQAEPEHEEAEL
jgi:multicomponent Na+:H+ antiporter subunit G